MARPTWVGDARGAPEEIDPWMAWRLAERDQRSQDEALGRQAWVQSSESDSPLDAARPLDVVNLGRKLRRFGGDRSPKSLEEVYLGDGFEGGAAPETDRHVKAKRGDSISSLLGTSAPGAVGRFMRVNGLRNSGLAVGRDYQVPHAWDDASDAERRAGGATLNADNRRLAQEADEKAFRRVQADRFNGGQNIWTGAPREGMAPRPGTSAPTALRSWLDDSVAAKRVAGIVANAAGVAPGAVRGGVHAIDGAVDAAVLLGRLVNPVGGADTDAAWNQVADVGQAGVEYVRRRLQEPSLIGADIDAGVRDFKNKHWLGAQPVSDTFAGELQRGWDVGLNDGELLFDGASLVGSGTMLKAASRLGAAAKAAEATEVAFLAKNPGLAADFEDLYSGMSHHIMPRRTKLPSWLGGGPVPPWIMEAPFNKIRDYGLTRRDAFRNHVGSDRFFAGGKTRREFGGGTWRAADLGWEPYEGLDRFPSSKASLSALYFGAAVDPFRPDKTRDSGWR